MRVYLDNAATTPIDQAVVDAIMPYYGSLFGNPSATHAAGREVKAAIEMARRDIAKLINAHPLEIYFTSGGTEASNMAMMGAVRDLGVSRIITSPIEHHCVLHTAEFLKTWTSTELRYVEIDTQGNILLDSLEALLQESGEKTLVSLMHANNEIGTIAPLAEISLLCKKYGALLHSDTVQTFAHLPLDVKALDIDFITASAHKFHGPKGSGFLYAAKKNKIGPLLQGGGQERQLRAGTENITGIIGMAKAAVLAYENLDEDRQRMEAVKNHLRSALITHLPGITFNGAEGENQLFTILSASFPPHPKNDLLLFQLDLRDICASGGSACTSGADAGSHVINAIHGHPLRKTVRFSFSKYNTLAEADRVIEVVQEIYQ